MSSEATPRYKVFPGWRVVGGAFIANGMFSVVGLHAIGLLFKPMSEDLGWSRGATSVAFSLRGLTNAVLGPFLGPKIDSWGPRPFMLVGAVVAGAAASPGPRLGHRGPW